MRHRATIIAPLLAALLAAGCAGGGAPAGGDAAGGGVEFRPVASIGQLMDSIVIPRSDEIFESVVYVNGELTVAPETLDEWARLEFAAMAIAESGNLMLIPPRLRDEGDWVDRAHALTEAALEVLDAARAQDIEGMLLTGGVLYDACLGCHEAYVPPDVF